MVLNTEGGKKKPLKAPGKGKTEMTEEEAAHKTKLAQQAKAEKQAAESMKKKKK